MPGTRYPQAVSTPRSLLDASELAPLDLDLRRVFWAFIAAWGAALAVVVVLAAVGSAPGRAVAVCATGFVLGFVALAWERWRFGPRTSTEQPDVEPPDVATTDPATSDGHQPDVA